MNRLQVLLLALFAATSVCLTACSSSHMQVRSSDNTISTYDRVMKSGTIRCGYVLYQPGCIKDPNTGKLSGIGPESLEKIATRLGLKVEWTEEVGWGSMLEGLEAGRYDMVASPVWTNATRAKLCDFSKPLFYSPVCAYVNSKDKRFQRSLDSANAASVTISTIDGETAEVIANADFSKCRKVSLPQLTDLSQMLLAVSSGKADMTFTEPTIATGFQKHNLGSLSVANGGKPVRVFPNCWMYKRNQSEFKNMIDTLIDEISNDESLDKIIASHESAPGMLYRVTRPYCLPETTTPQSVIANEGIIH
jgi:polar amino acid transport system substrate-binding protein